MNQARPIILYSSLITFLVLGLISALAPLGEEVQAIQVNVSPSVIEQPIDGRVLLLVSRDGTSEPRFQVKPGVDAIQIFGRNIEGFQQSDQVVFDEQAFGYPLKSLRELPAGDYYVQALLLNYETYNIEDGESFELPVDQEEGAQWRSAPGNLFSKPQKIQLSSRSSQPIQIVIDQVIP